MLQRPETTQTTQTSTEINSKQKWEEKNNLMDISGDKQAKSYTRKLVKKRKLIISKSSKIA